MRLKVDFNYDNILKCYDTKYFSLIDWFNDLYMYLGQREYLDFNKFVEDAKSISKKEGYKWKKVNLDALIYFFTTISPDAQIVLDDNGNPIPDKALEDSEIIPFRYPDGIDGFLQNEILPYASDAWIDQESIQTGYELSFTKYFYKPKELRTIAEISKDIRDIEQRTDGMLNEIIG